VYVSLCETFVVKVIKNRRWSGNDGCRMPQENVVKFQVALHPSFPDS